MTSRPAAEGGVDSTVPHGRLDRYDRDMLAFFAKWAPYGGPPASEVFPEFGISLPHLLARVEEIVHASVRADIPDPDAVLLHRVRCLVLARRNAAATRTAGSANGTGAHTMSARAVE